MKIPVLVLSLTLGGTAHADCAALFVVHQQTDMVLSYELFDQSEASGFRVLAQAGSYAEAERLILQYVQENGKDGSNGALWWHAAQMSASAGNYAQAARHAKRSLSNRPANGPLLWNEYVLASIAFFERDRPTLQRYRDVIAARGKDFWGNRMNLNLLDTMLEAFDLGYAEIGERAMQRWEARAEEKAR